MNNEKLIDMGDFYLIKDYKSIVEYDEHGKVLSAIHCPYIPKFLVDGPAMVSIGR